MPKGIYRAGTFKRKVKKQELVQPDGPYRLIPLTMGQVAIVDADDFERLNRFNWFAIWSKYTKSFYARRKENRKSLSMHQEIIECPKGQVVDHKNHNTLDNRKENLRPATRSQNNCNRAHQSSNRSGYVGVNWYPKYNKWVARVVQNGRRVLVGYFASIEDAVAARDRAATEYYGEFAFVNNPTSDTSRNDLETRKCY